MTNKRKLIVLLSVAITIIFIAAVVGMVRLGALLQQATNITPEQRKQWSEGFEKKEGRKKAALALWRTYRREGFDIYVETGGDNDEVIVLRDQSFKYGDLGFESVKIKESGAFGNEDFWSLGCPKKEETSPAEAAGTSVPVGPGKKTGTSNTSLPKFRVLPQRVGYPVSIVVPVTTTDTELENLLWFIRGKVQQKRFSEFGIAQGTSAKLAGGGYDYNSGMFLIFRGEKCATENFFDEHVGDGPCGYGDHNAAFYHWGIGGNPAKDTGDIEREDGRTTTVFER
jgi:hypothetical protein